MPVLPARRPAVGSSAARSSATRKLLPAREAMRRAVSNAVEALEPRRLLTTLTGGGFSANGTPLENTYLYLDAQQNVCRIAVWGQISAEAIFVGVDKFNGLHVEDAVAPTAANFTANAGADLFNIYIAAADPHSSISISEINSPPPNGTTPPDFGAANMIPFGAPGFSLSVANEQTGQPTVVSSDSRTGEAYLGARQYLKPATTATGTPTGQEVPVLTVNLSRQFGVRPVTASKKIDAGVTTAPSVNLNRFFFGGTITGRVDIGGSIESFYAGQLLTGDASGVSFGSQPPAAYQHNFNVGGNIDNLVVSGSIGTAGALQPAKPTYKTGFRMSVGGHVGQVTTNGDFYGSGNVVDNPALKLRGTTQHELEGTGANPTNNESFFEGNAPTSNDKIGVPSLGDDATKNNNTFANAQFLGTRFSSLEGHRAIQLQGTVDNTPTVGDGVDIYAIPLMGGQRVTATLTELGLGGTTTTASTGTIALGIFEPDALTSNQGLLASSYREGDTTTMAGQPITFTTKEPGIYYLAVAFSGDTTFSGTGAPIFGETPYELDVKGVGEIALGGLVAVNNISFPVGGDPTDPTLPTRAFPSISAENGDLGAVLAMGGSITVEDIGTTPGPFTATNGNIRVVQASGSMGTLINGLLGYAPDMQTPDNVGLLKTGGDMNCNNADVPIGGNYQLIDCGGAFLGDLVTNKAIGTIRCNGMGATNIAPTLHVNADSKGSDGIIDLIDDTGSFGTAEAGGPHITTGPNGNVRYIHLTAGAAVFNDSFFGGGEDLATTYSPGTAVKLIDDSGTPFTLTPNAAKTGIAGDLTAPPTTGTGTSTSTSTTVAGTTTDLTAGSLSVLSYGVRDKGGVVAINVTETAGDVVVNTPSSSTGTTGTTTSVPTPGAGASTLTISTSAKGTNGSAEIGQVETIGFGTALTFDSSTRTFSKAIPTGGVAEVDNSVVFTGKSRIDAFDVATLTPGTTPDLSNFTTVNNATNGEIVNLETRNIGVLAAQNLGTALSHTGNEVSGAVVKINNFPWRNQRNLIQIGGDYVPAGGDGTQIDTGNFGFAQTIESSGALGNIFIDGSAGNVLARTDHKTAKGKFEGIDGPIYAACPTTFTTPAPSDVVGNLLNVDIGQGLASGGSGDFALSGIFADNAIASITNQGLGSDIRGPINATIDAGGLLPMVTLDPITGLPVTSNAPTGLGIDSINLTDGAIIDTAIYTTTKISDVLATTSSGLIADINTTHNPAFPVFAIGNINLTGKGGIIGTQIRADGVNTINIKGGFGFLNSNVDQLPGATLNLLQTDGYGVRNANFSEESAVGSIIANGAGREIPTNSYTASVRQSESGTADAATGDTLNKFDDLDLFLGTTKKHPTKKGKTSAGVIDRVMAVGTDTLGRMQAYRITNTALQFASNVGTIQTKDYVDGLAITAGTLSNFLVGTYVRGNSNSLEQILIADESGNTGTTVATPDQKPLNSFDVAGEVKNISVGFLSGSFHINASGPDGTIDSLTTKQGLNGTVNAATSIGSIVVGTDLASTSISTSGNLNRLLVKHSVLSGAFVRVKKTLGLLDVRHNILAGSTVQAQKIEAQQVGGVINGKIVITG